MKQVFETPLPDGALITQQSQNPGYFTDCYSVEVAVSVDLPALIKAFYTTPLFRLERLVLNLTAKGKMCDADVVALSLAKSDRMSVWRVEARCDTEILLNAGRTKSWLMTVPKGSGTQLYFGSVVVPEPPKKEGGAYRLGPVFDSLLSAHGVYSRLLLGSTARRLS